MQKIRNFVQKHGTLLEIMPVSILVLLLNSLLDRELKYTSRLPKYVIYLSVDFDPFALILLGLVIVFWLAQKRNLMRSMLVVFFAYLTLSLSVSTLLLSINPMKFRWEHIRLSILWDGILLWLIDILVFTSWYWLIDSPGLNGPGKHTTQRTDFLFPQQANNLPTWRGWEPVIMDYLFLACNTSTSFGPTDTLVLSRRAKLLMMMQVVLSLVTILVILARAVTLIP